MELAYPDHPPAILYGITTEYIQKFFIPGRSFNLADWLADTRWRIDVCLVCPAVCKMSGKV